MSDMLVRIKRAVLDKRYVFSNKARDEMKSDGITELDVIESVLNAVAIYKKVRSTNPSRSRAREYLYVIQIHFIEEVSVTRSNIYAGNNYLPILWQRQDQEAQARLER
jgi:hypothetical protein